MLRRLLLVVSALLLLSACDRILGPGNENDLATASEESCGFVQNAYGQRISWNTFLPIQVYIHSSVSSSYEEGLREAVKTWEKIVGRPLINFTRFSGGENTVQQDGKNVVMMIGENWPKNLSRHQAITDLYWSANQIVEADIRINEQNFLYSVDEDPEKSVIHFPSLLLHEVGHLLGLTHYTTQPTVMWPVLQFGMKRTDPSSEDRGHIKCEY